jgi:hypothetical protein
VAQRGRSPPSLVLRLHKNGTSMRNIGEERNGDSRRSEGLSLVAGGWRAHDALGRAKEEDSGDDTWGNGSASSRR